MGKLEQFREEYLVLEPEENLTSKEEVLNYWDGEMTILTILHRSINTALFKDKIDLFLATYIFGESEEKQECLYRDVEILKRYSSSISTYKSLYRRLISNINDDNFHDIYCLGQFLGEKGNLLFQHYNRELAGVECACKGMNVTFNVEDETPIVRGFFEEELAKITAKGKTMVKK